MAHLAVPIKITDVKEVLVLINTLLNTCFTRTTSLTGNPKAQMRALCSTIKARLTNLDSEFSDMVRFYTTSGNNHKNLVIEDFDEIAHAQNARLISTPSPHEATTTTKKLRIIDNMLVRKKRQIFAAVAAVLSAVGSSMLFGFLAESKIQKIVDKINMMVDKDNLLVHQIEKNSKEISINRQSISEIATLVGNIMTIMQKNSIEIEIEALALYVNSLLNDVQHKLDTFNKIVAAGSQQRFAFGTLSYSAASRALSKIRKDARKLGLHSVVTDPQQLFQCPTSFMKTEDGIIVLIHIFLVQSDQIFSLYRYSPFPISLSDKVQVLVTPPKQLFGLSATSNTQNEKQLYIELNEMDLLECVSFNEIHVCPKLSVLSHISFPSCLSSLYFVDHSLAISLCKLHITPIKDRVIPLKRNHFLAFTTNPKSYEIFCYSNQTRVTGLQLKETQEIVVPDNCYVDLPSFRLFSQTDLYVSSEIKSYQWNIEPAKMFLELTPDQLTTSIEELQKLQGLPPTSLADLRTFHKLNHPYSWTNISSMFSFSVSSIATVVLGFLFLICIYIYLKKKAQRLNQFIDKNANAPEVNPLNP